MKYGCFSKEIAVDGKLIESNLVPVFGDGKEHLVKAKMGS